METVILSQNHNEPINLNIYSGKSHGDHFIVIVGGKGDTRNVVEPLALNLIDAGSRNKVVTFSFRGEETNKQYPAIQQVDDLKEVLDYLINKKGAEHVSIVCTSMGAVSTTVVLTVSKYNSILENGVYLDPADYLEISRTETELPTWSGYDKYELGMGVLSTLIKSISGSTKVSVVNFTIRNRDVTDYAAVEKRAIDNSDLKERLNNKMVKAIYDNIPEKNKGKYIEDNSLPHAFFRDGNIKQNIDKVSKLIITQTT